MTYLIIAVVALWVYLVWTSAGEALDQARELFRKGDDE